MDTGLFSLGSFWGSEIANHLWQSSLFAVAAWLLTLCFKKNRARVRYWIWVAVSVKFLIPFSLLISLGNSIDIGWTSAPDLNPPVSAADWTVVQNINQPFSSPSSISSLAAGGETVSKPSTLPAVTLVCLWVFGAIGCLFFWMKKNRYISRVIRESEPLSDGHAFAALLRLQRSGKTPAQIRLALSKTSMEPGVFGIFRPILLLPDGMTERLERSELEAILEHELSHIRCRDNLVAAFHMFVEALFWFHPMVWWIGSRLVHEREKACDEAVLQSGKEPQAYAEGILKVCEFYLESPLACASGVIGSNLKKRIEGIMKQCVGRKLTAPKKLLLLGTCLLALGTPLLIGSLTSKTGLAQSQDNPKPSFDVASIKPIDDCRETISLGGGEVYFVRSGPVFQPGRFTGCLSLKGFVSRAYQIEESEISGGPDWTDSDNFKIEAKAEGVTNRDTLRLMLQSLLEERFGLELHYETQEKPVYSLIIAEGGHKLERSRDENGDLIEYVPKPGEPRNTPMPDFRDGVPPRISGGIQIMVLPNTDRQEISAHAITMQKFTNKVLKRLTGRRVVDKTGLTGYYDFEFFTRFDRQLDGIGLIEPAPFGSAAPVPTAEPSGPSVFTAVQEQLGLKLEADEAPIELLVIDSADKPSEN